MEKVEKELGIRPVTYVVGIIIVAMISIIGAWLAGFTRATITGAVGWPTGSGYDWTIGPCVLQLFWPFVISLVLSLIPKNLRFNRQELTIILTMIWVTWLLPTYWGITSVVHPTGVAMGIGAPYSEWIKTDWYYLYSPPPEDVYWHGFLYGGAGVPWTDWAVPLAYWIITIFSLYFMYAFLACLMRRIWIDVERVPFPTTLSLAELIESNEGEKRPKFFRNMWLWIGLVLGVLLHSPLWLHLVTPTIPFWPMGIDLTPMSIIQNAPLYIQLLPLLYAAFYLMSPSTLLGGIVFYIIMFWIIPAIMTASGAVPPVSGATYEGVNVQWMEGTGGAWASFGWWSYGYISILWGALFGLTAWTLFRWRGYVAQSIKSLWKKPPADVDAKEPIPYRLQWIGLILCFLIFSGMIALGAPGIPYWWCMIYTFEMIWFVGFSYAVFRSEVTGGTVTGPPWNNTHIWTAYTAWWFWSPTSPVYGITGGGGEAGATLMARLFYTAEFELHGYDMVTVAAPSASLLESFKLGALEGVHPKKQFTAAMIALSVGVIVTLIAWLTFCYQYGVLAQFSDSATMGWNGYYTVLVGYFIAKGTYPWMWYNNTPPTVWIHLAEAIGAIVTIALFVLRARFPWFPIHPIGLALALVPEGGHMAALFPLIGAYILKRLTISVGGMKLFQEKGVPLATGIMISLGFVAFIAGFNHAYIKLSGI